MGWWTVFGMCAVAAAFPTLPLAAQETALRAGAAEVRVGGQLQFQALASSCTGFPPAEGSACTEQAPGLDWYIRRMRLSLDVRVNDRIEARVQPEFGQADGLDAFVLRDAYGRLRLNPAARLTIGNFKRPFDGFQLTSSSRTLTIERDVDIPGVPGPVAGSLDELTSRLGLSDRDLGVMVDGATADGRARYWIGAFNGNGPEANRDVNTEKQFVGRVEVRLGGDALPLAVAVAGALTDVPFTHPAGRRDATYFGAGELWAELGSFGPGPHVQAGLVFGGNPLQTPAGGAPDFAADDEMARMWAFQAIGGYRVAVAEGWNEWIEAVQPVFRVTRADPNTPLGGDENWGLTPGVQLFFHERNKLAVNWDVALFDAEGAGVEHSLKAQLQVHF